MKSTLIFCFWILLMLLSGCTRESIIPMQDQEVSVSLALSVGRTVQPGTKMSETVTQSSMTPESFRGIEKVFILPFKTGSTSIGLGDVLWDYRVALPQKGLESEFLNQADGNRGLVYNNYAHFYDKVYLRPETDAVLVYGKAQDASLGTSSSTSVAYLQHNGSLAAPNLDNVQSTDEIVFSPVPYSSTENTAPLVVWRNDLINKYLNSILKASVSSSGASSKTFRFNDPVSYEYHPVLTAALEEFTNKGIYFPLSAEVLAIKLTKLYQALYPLATDPSQSVDYYYLPKNGVAFPYVYELAKAVIKKIYDDTKTSDQNTYATRYTSSGQYAIRMKTNGPAVFGLPSGTIPIQWKESQSTDSREFMIVYNIDHYTGLGYIPSDEICYPPSLWYYVNSPLVSTDKENMAQKYTSSYTWESISSNYTYPGVDSQSKSAIVRDPVKYGVAMMELTCTKPSSNLPDFAGTPVDINNEKFPLTGIIVADQYPLAFDFTPMRDEDLPTRSMRYIYDADVNDSNGNARVWISRRSATSNAVLTTLVLPTRPESDVRFALEFLNKTNYTSVVGANGCKIQPGQHFYLAGILKYADRTDHSGNSLSSVFVSGYKTEVEARFTSFKAAYDVVPDLSDPQLQLGVKAEFGWNMSTPTNVPIVIQ